MIGGLPASVAMDLHACSLPPVAHQPTVSPFSIGSTSVLICGKPAIRVGDICVCGATPLLGCPTVQLGG